MWGAQILTASDTSVRIAPGMRVVLLEQDPAVRAKMRAAIDSDVAFVLAGESDEWSGCQTLLERFIPELLLARINQVPSKFLETMSNADFPVLVGLRGERNGSVTPVGVYDTLEVPPQAEHIRGLLARVRREIYRRQADELSFLVERYVACTPKGEARYLSTLRVEDGEQTLDVAIEDVSLLAADGNYVCIHAHSRTYEIRDTLTGIGAKLDAAQFVRVHRSYIVNLLHVLDVGPKNSGALKLSDGMEVPIGPNYREEVENIVRQRERLSA